MTALNAIWLIPVLPLLGFAALGLGALAGEKIPKRAVALIGCGVIALAFALSLTAVMGLAGLDHHHREHLVTAGPWIPALELGWTFALDPLSSVMILIVTGVGLLIHIYSVGYMWDEPGFGRYFCYLNLFMAMMLTLVLGASLPLLFVGWEGVGLCSYLLIGYFYTKTDCADAGRKAFIVNRIGDASFIIGMLLAWVTFGGTFDIAAILERAPGVAAASPGTVSLIALLLFGGACGKSAQIPLYVWLPDAMAGPTPVSALIHAATMVTAGVYMVCRLAPLFVLAPSVMTIVAVVGMATAVLAAVIAIGQNDIKKVLAYSTISQLGYMFMAAGVGAFGAAIFHVTTHAFFKALLFLGSGAVIHALHGEQDMRRMGGLRKQLPRTFLFFAAGWIALAGVPLTSGFFSKDEILYHAYLARPALWAVGAVTALMTAVYMTRLMGMTFFGPSRVDPKTAHHVHEAPPTMWIPLAILAVLSLLGGFMGMPESWESWVGDSPFHSWLHPVFALPEEVASPGHGGPEMVLMLISSLLAIGGIVLGYWLWVTRPDVPARIAAALPGLYTAVRDKLLVDEMYDAAIVRPYHALCRALARFDTIAVDGAVNGVATMMETSGQVLKMFHSGFVRNYALLYLAGAAAVLWYMVG